MEYWVLFKTYLQESRSRKYSGRIFMARYQDSPAKQTIRFLLRDACECLQRGSLTYLGLPAEDALDIKVLGPILENVICVDEKDKVLDETRRSIASLPLHVRRFEQAKMWQYLRDRYPAEPLVGDITFLDFYGGGLVKDDPYAQEIAGLRSYFAKHATHPNKTFVLAWTYMPRDKGKQHYVQACEKIIPEKDLALLKNRDGVWARSIAVRLLLRQSLLEHGMNGSIFQHAVYKKTMNTLILLYSKGRDRQCRLSLDEPPSLLKAPVCVYEPKMPVPQIVPFPL
jgi:hypothetical protein